MTDGTPLNIVSQEEREDGIHVVAEVLDDLELARKLSRAEMNELLEKEGLSVRIREESPKTVDESLESIDDHLRAIDEIDQKRFARLFQNYDRVTTHRGPSRDRSLSGKARRRARQGR